MNNIFSLTVWTVLLIVAFLAATGVIPMVMEGQLILFFTALFLSAGIISNLMLALTDSANYPREVVYITWAVGVLSAVVLGLEWFNLLQFTEVTHNLCTYLIIVAGINLATVQLLKPKN